MAYIVTTVKHGATTLAGRLPSKVYTTYWDDALNVESLVINNEKIQMLFNFKKLIKEHKAKLLRNPSKYMR